MRKSVKNEKGYEKSFDANWSEVKTGLSKARAMAGELRKVPTSIAMDPILLADLKREANLNGVPYQVLMRMFIIQGFQEWKKHHSA